VSAFINFAIEREWKRLKVVAEQVREVEVERDRLVKGSEPTGDICAEKMRRLVKLHGIGAEFATVLTGEVFYRPFQNRRQVGSYVGFTPAPYDSGDTKHDQGINKAGNPRARAIAVQMAWLWLRYQSKSDLALWYYRRVGDLKGRVRRIHDHRSGTQAGDRSLAICRDRQGTDRRNRHCLASRMDLACASRSKPGRMCD
jgi:transposase